MRRHAQIIPESTKIQVYTSSSRAQIMPIRAYTYTRARMINSRWSSYTSHRLLPHPYHNRLQTPYHTINPLTTYPGPFFTTKKSENKKILEKIIFWGCLFLAWWVYIGGRDAICSYTVHPLYIRQIGTF